MSCYVVARQKAVLGNTEKAVQSRRTSECAGTRKVPPANNPCQRFSQKLSEFLSNIPERTFVQRTGEDRRSFGRWKSGGWVRDKEQLKTILTKLEANEFVVDELASLHDECADSRRGTRKPNKPAEDWHSMDEIRITADPEVVKWQVGPPHDDWLCRLKYLGFHGAANWLRWERDEAYMHDRKKNIEQVAELCLSLLNQDSRIGTLVSLGPGSGELDEWLFNGLQRGAHKPLYIPVDISDALLGTAWLCLRDAGATIPICILGDFEDRLSWILDRVHERGEPPYLFTLCGNTFGNFEQKTENAFLSSLRAGMSKDDRLILHVGVKGPTYDRSKDKRFGLDDSDDAGRYFIAYALARKAQWRQPHDERRRDASELLHMIASEIHEHVDFRGSAESSVPGTETIAYLTKHHAGCPVQIRPGTPVQIIHRYDRARLETWLEGKGWKVVNSDKRELYLDNDVHDAAILLAKG